MARNHRDKPYQPRTGKWRDGRFVPDGIVVAPPAPPVSISIALGQEDPVQPAPVQSGTAPGYRASSPEEIQSVYNLAFEQGILEEPLQYDPESGVTEAWIEVDGLHETIAPQPGVDDARIDETVVTSEDGQTVETDVKDGAVFDGDEQDPTAMLAAGLLALAQPETPEVADTPADGEAPVEAGTGDTETSNAETTESALEALQQVKDQGPPGPETPEEFGKRMAAARAAARARRAAEAAGE